MGVKRGVGGAYEQVRCLTTHNEGTSRAEGKGPTGIEVSGIVRDKNSNEVETLCLIALLLKGTFGLFLLTGWPGYLKWRVERGR